VTLNLTQVPSPEASFPSHQAGEQVIPKVMLKNLLALSHGHCDIFAFTNAAQSRQLTSRHENFFTYEVL
jgi:hypothetical protein